MITFPASSASEARWSWFAGMLPGGSAATGPTATLPSPTLSPNSSCLIVLPSQVSASTKIRLVAASITGVPVIPTTGLMSPHKS